MFDLINAVKALCKAIAWLINIKAAIATFAIVTLPQVIKYIYMKWGDEILGWVMTNISNISGLEYNGLVIELTGFAAYIAQKLRFVDVFAVIISTTLTMFLLSFIRK